MPERAAAWTHATLVAAIIALAWVPYFSASLLLDESGTWWTIAKGFSEVWGRAFPNVQSLFYCHFLWAWTAAVGSEAEWVMRLPSALASVGTLAALYRLGSDAFGREHRFLPLLLWLLFLHPPGLEVQIRPPSIVLQARPYAMAMCAGAWALVAAYRFAASGDRRMLWGFALLAGLTPWFSPFFLAPLAGCGLWLAWVAGRRLANISLAEWAAACGLWAALAAPLIPQILHTAGQSALHAIGYTASLRADPPMVWAPPAIAIGVLGAMAASLAAGRRAIEEPISREQSLLLGLSLLIAVLSVVPLYAGGRATGSHLTQSRYLCLAYAPLAVLYTSLLARYAGAMARVGAAVIAVIFVLGTELAANRSQELEWAHSYPRIVAEIEQERGGSLGAAAVYLGSGFVEASRTRFPEAQSHSDFLAPFLYYRLSEPFELLPATLESCDPQWAAELVARIQNHAAFIYAGSAVPRWLVETTAQTHSMRAVRQSPAYSVVVGTRSVR